MTKPHKPDYILIAIVLILLVFGLVMISSASQHASFQKFGEIYYYFNHQLLYGALIGLLLLFLVQKIHYHLWKKVALLAFLVSLVFLVIVFIPEFSVGSGGAKRWIELGKISFQPSEIAKLAFILYLAAWLEKKGKEIKNFSEGFLPFVAISALVTILIVLQPDISTAGIIALIATVVYFIAGGRLAHLFLLVLTGATVLLALIKIAPYRMSRLTVFLHPEIDPQGIGYQTNQALLALGSGGIFGKGLGQGLQKRGYLPQPAGDSIFAIIGEELGLIGVLFLISLFVLLAFRGFKIAKHAPDTFSRLVASGITCWLVFQAFIHMAAISALVPLTGIPLPFISYGSSALVASLISVGILFNISKHTT